MLNSFIVGSGKPHIWLHGLLGNRLNLSQIAKSQPGLHYLLDARNHGNSFQKIGMDYKTQAEDVVRFMDKNNVDKAVIFGLSMGGKTAMALSLLYPERVSSVCVFDIAPICYLKVMEAYYNGIREYIRFIKTVDLKNTTREQIENSFQEKFGDRKITNLISTNLVLTENGLKWRIGVKEIELGIDEVGQWDVTGKYFGNFKAVVGENSVHTSRNPLISAGGDVKGLYSGYFPNTEVEVIKGAGHYVHVDNPEAVRNSVNKFILSVS